MPWWLEGLLLGIGALFFYLYGHMKGRKSSDKDWARSYRNSQQLLEFDRDEKDKLRRKIGEYSGILERQYMILARYDPKSGYPKANTLDAIRACEVTIKVKSGDVF